MSVSCKVVKLKGTEDPPNPPKLIDSIDRYKDSLCNYQTTETPKRPCIVIDNGSYNTRAGWSFEDAPYLNFRSQVAKPKAFNKEFSDSVYLVGDECNLFEAGRIQKRSAFDKNVVYHINSQEAIFDYTFSHLGVSGDSVNYPVLLTEAFCNPNYSRAMVTELLFESYRVPYLTLGVDFLFSFYYNQVNYYKDSCAPLSGLVISSSHNTTQVVPILNSRVHVSNSKRVGIGGRHHNELLGKSLSMRYQVHKAKITPAVVSEIQENHTACATNYADQLRHFEAEYEKETLKIKDEERLKREIMLEGHSVANKNRQIEKQEDSKGDTHSHLLAYRNQIDFKNSLISEDTVLPDRIIQLDWSPEEQPSEEDLKRKENMRKEQGQRLREINLKKRQEKLDKMQKELDELEPFENDKTLDEDPQKLKQLGFKSFDELLDKIETLREKLGIAEKSEKGEEEKWPLLNIEDEDLDADQIKLKRIQKMQKSSFLKRMEKHKKMEAEKAKIEELKKSDPQGYLDSLYRKRKKIYKRIEYRQERREQMKKRDGFNRKMKTIAKIGAVDEDVNKKNKKLGKNKAKNEESDDDFGANDDDWNLYKDISKHGFEEGEDEEDQQALEEINEQIAEVDPKFACMFGTNETKQLTEEDFQLRLSSDRFRGAEIMFQPSIIGHENAGLTEVLENLFQLYDPQQAQLLCDYILLTGGNTKIDNFDNRVKNEIRMLRPPESKINVVRAYDPDLDAWKGGTLFARRDDFIDQTSISKAQYEECGPHYFKEHFGSNLRYGEALEVNPTAPIDVKRQKVTE